MSKYTGLYQTKAACFQYKIKECDCIVDDITKEYNLRVAAFITNNSFENQNMVIVEKGRTVNERSAVLVENGVYKGYTFYDLNYQITNIEILKNILIPMQNNRDTRNIIQGHI
jgi:DNA polymerase-3 subunit epsilon